MSTEEVIGFKENGKKGQHDPEIEKLSNEQKKIRKDIESCQQLDKRKNGR